MRCPAVLRRVGARDPRRPREVPYDLQKGDHPRGDPELLQDAWPEPPHGAIVLPDVVVHRAEHGEARPVEQEREGEVANQNLELLAREERFAQHRPHRELQPPALGGTKAARGVDPVELESNGGDKLLLVLHLVQGQP